MKPKTIEEIAEEYRSLFSTGHSEMPKDELVFVPDKESKRAEDWLRTTLTSLIEQEIALMAEKKNEISKKHPNWDGKIGYIQACDDHIAHLKGLIK